MGSKSVEDLVVDKIYEIVTYKLSNVIEPDMRLDKVAELDDKMIRKIKKEYGIEGIILDVDETLRKGMDAIPKCNEEWIEKLKRHFKVIVVSNGADKDMQDFFKLKGIDYIGFACKPLKRSFMKACKKMDIQPHKVLVIGDNIIDDIHGGKRNNMKTLLIKNVETGECR